VIDANGRRFVNYGAFSVTDPRPVERDTIFEIGSITKVFTSLLLSDMVQKGEVSLDDPVAKYLPPDVKVPERAGKKITLVDLSKLDRIRSEVACRRGCAVECFQPCG
jgi:CubicO group peptidase (beta-lactamase class C family)